VTLLQRELHVPRQRASARLRIRRATRADAARIGRLLHDGRRERDAPTPEPPLLAQRVRELLADGGTEVLLAGAQPCGLAVLRLRKSLWSPALQCCLTELYVQPAHRGHGIGRALLLAAIDLARTAGADQIDLGTAETDVAARALTESLGFDAHGRPAGPLTLHYERGL